MGKLLQVFCCYARQDQEYLYDLKKHLKSLEREELIEIKADIDISPGAEWEREINRLLEEADIILLLISPDFIASDYCFGKEMRQAIARHERETACVIPVIVRPTLWENMPFSKLQALPKDAQAVTTWTNPDAAWVDVARGVKEAIDKLPMKGPIPTNDNDRSPKISYQRIDMIFLKSLLTYYEIKQLGFFNNPGPFYAKKRGEFIEELKRLLLFDLIGRKDGKGIGPLEDDFDRKKQVNIKDYFYITEKGKELLHV